MSTIIDGTTGITTDGLIVGVEKAQLIKLETAKATTSGTTVDFTGIPSWAKKITVIFNGVSTNGTSLVLVQIGSGSITTSGYLSTANFSGSITTSTSGYLVTQTLASNSILSGHCIITLLSSNVYIQSSLIAGYTGVNAGAFSLSGGYSPALAGSLDRIRITAVNGTDIFDAGSVNILIEGSL
jgi:hypothetical protein